MGFIDALYALGRRELERSGSGEFADVDSFCQMPMDLIESDEESARWLPGKELQVWLDVPDPKAECLDVRGIRKIEVADFWGGGGDDRAKKRRYLYKKITGNCNWRYSPVYSLKNGVADGRKVLMDSHFSKISKVLLGFEKKPEKNQGFYPKKIIFSPGSVDLIMNALAERVDELAELWSDKRRSYLLIFGASDTERFYYPVDTPAFLAYFRSCFASVSEPEIKTKNTQARKSKSVPCGICHNLTTSPVNFDKIFTFATFDKKSFLPGVEDGDASKAKVFPLCDDCCRILSRARNVVEEKFRDSRSVPKIKNLPDINIYVIPELLTGTYDFGNVESKSQDFMNIGLRHEEFLAKNASKHGDGLVYHFIFWEPNQKQQRILLMVEDVPPSRLRRLDALWKEAVSMTGALKKSSCDEDDATEKAKRAATLPQAIQVIMGVLIGLNEKNNKDAGVLRDQSLGMLGRLLSGKRVDPQWVKRLIVSRLPGLCADSEWVRSDKVKMEKTKTDSPKRSRVETVRRWNAIVDFLYRANKSVQSVPDGGERQIRVKG